MKPKPGEVWLADLGLAGKTRPVVVLSIDDPAAPRALIIYIPPEQDLNKIKRALVYACHLLTS